MCERLNRNKQVNRMNQICKKKENRYSLELLYVKLFQKAKSKGTAEAFSKMQKRKNTRETDAST